MLNVSTSELMREVDRHMTEDIGIPSAVLMENAARAVAEAVLSCGRGGECVILIGPGNNGGDGLAALRLLAVQGRGAVGILLCDPEKLRGDALLNYKIAKRLGLPLTSSLEPIEKADIIVDALFGTGLDREIGGIQLEAIKRANASRAYRIAVDVPSGINGTSGRTLGAVFHAHETVTFVALKRGQLVTSELECVGKLTCVQIGMTDEAHRLMLERERLMDGEAVRALIGERKRYSNKGSNGRALLIVGSEGMPGAAVMAAAACVRTGAGLTTAFVPKSIFPAFAALPEAMLAPSDESPIDEKLSAAGAVCIGCGIGNAEKNRELLEKALLCGKKAVIDADALNLISRERELLPLLNENHVITPHPGEMARLMECDISTVTNDMHGAALGFAKAHGCTVLLKNAVSVIASADGRVRYNASGNTGLAKGGSGDCLSGIVTALLAQGLAPFDAACCGAYLLGCAADEAMDILITRMLTASDICSALEKMRIFSDI